MAMELIQSETFYTDLFRVPQNERNKFIRALSLIQSEPFVAKGHAKKCFKHQFNNVYRYRIGKYRIVYSVGKGFVRLLAVDKRGNIYKRFNADPDIDLDPETVFTADPKAIPTIHYDEPVNQPPAMGEDPYIPPVDEESDSEVKQNSTFLIDLLKQWNIPEQHITAIAQCKSLDDMLDLDIEDRVKDVILGWTKPATVEEIIDEKIYELPSVEYLEKYLDGSLKGFLLKLDPEQMRVSKKNLQGPTLVKGGPGTGKSLVALYRIRNLMEQDAQKHLFNNELPQVLFVTYTTTLISASEQLLAPLLGKAMRNVSVKNLDKIVRKIIGKLNSPFNPASPKQKKDALSEAIKLEKQHDDKNAAVLDRVERLASLDYIISEFDWVIEGRQINALDEYLAEDRSGRELRFDKEIRKSIWKLHDRYLNRLQKIHKSTWDLLRAQALLALVNSEISEQSYDVVIVDEAQDLTPVGLRLCLALSKKPEGLYMTADQGQSIYNRGFSWKRVDEAINVMGRTTILKYNYRSTRQIAAAAMQPTITYGGGDPETASPRPVREGVKPVLISCNDMTDQVKRTISFLKEAAETMRLPLGAGAVLVPNNKTGEQFAEELSQHGLPAALTRGNGFNMDDKKTKVLTMHSAKGLEFPFVAVVRMDKGQLPILWNVKDADERESKLAEGRRLFSVAMSRAMRRLAVLYDRNKPSLYIDELDRSLWS